MESGTIICNCKQVTFGQIEDVVRGESNIKDVVSVFDDVQKQTRSWTSSPICSISAERKQGENALTASTRQVGAVSLLTKQSGQAKSPQAGR